MKRLFSIVPPRLLLFLKGTYQSIQVKSILFLCKIKASSIDNVALVRNKLLKRGVKWNKERPTKVIAVFSINNWEKVLIEHLNSIGPVYHICWPHINDFFDTSSEWLKKRKRINSHIQSEFEKHYESDKNIVVFFYTSDFIISSDTLNSMKKSNVIMVSFCWDDLLYFKGNVRGQLVGVQQMSREVDFNLTLSPEAIPRYNIAGSACFFWEGIPVPNASAELLPKKDSHQGDNDFYVLFIGTRYGWRSDFIGGLKKKGINVKCYGKGWENGTISDDQMQDEIFKAPVVLGFANVGYTKDITTIKGRDFEVPAFGGLYLTQFSEGIKLVYQPDFEILCYRDFEECFQKICFVRDNYAQAASIRLAGYRKAIQTATWSSRMLYLRKLIDIATAA